jgi:hypothetical protein
MRFDRLGRRDLMKLLGGAMAAPWPLVADAQKPSAYWCDHRLSVERSGSHAALLKHANALCSFFR